MPLIAVFTVWRPPRRSAFAAASTALNPSAKPMPRRVPVNTSRTSRISSFRWHGPLATPRQRPQPVGAGDDRRAVVDQRRGRRPDRAGQGERQRADVHPRDDPDVLVDDAHRLPRGGDGFREPPQVVVGEHDVGGLARHIRGAAERHRGVGVRERDLHVGLFEAGQVVALGLLFWRELRTATAGSAGAAASLPRCRCFEAARS